MRCSKCGFENPEGMKFCGQCTNPLVLLCAKCRFENPPGFKFCGQCTAPLSASEIKTSPAVQIDKPATDAEGFEGERKTVTALFADIKGSTELMRDLDPEEARAIIDPVLQLMMAAVHRYGGYVAQSTGDGIFALFGAPVAHEDHPQRALHAALAMQEKLRRYSDPLRAEGKTPIEARVGVNTGEVVVRTIETGGHTEYAPVGHVTNLAARMQTAAPAGSVVASQAMQRLCEGYFEFRALGTTTVKGLSNPVEVYEVVRAGPLKTHFQLAARRGLTKFVGRQAEMAAIVGALEQASAGYGQIVAAVGEAGAGKSRLMYEFKNTIPDGCKVLEAYSVSHGKASAWLPVIELLKGYFEIADQDDDSNRSAKIERKARDLDPALTDALSYIKSLLGIASANASLATMDSHIKRRRTLEAVKQIIVRESLQQTVVIIFEDLHWIDEQTQGLLDQLVESVASTHILMLVNYRPEYRHTWSNRNYCTQLRLDSLKGQKADEMLDALLGVDESLQSLKRLVIEKTQGNPFFMEEIVRSLIEQGLLVHNGGARMIRPMADISIPPTVQGILASRIDALPAPEKSLLQSLAVIGKDFPLNLVKQLAGSADDLVEPMLKRLQAGEFIYEQFGPDEAEYTFKHVLTQEVAYNSQLLERRRRLHERTGEAIETLFKDRIDDHLAELAHHYSRSANMRKATEYLLRAGTQASDRCAHSEAAILLSSALEFLKRMPDDPERASQELAMLSVLGRSLANVKGWAAVELEPVYTRARELCRQIRDPGLVLRVLHGQWLMRWWKYELSAALELADELLAAAGQMRDPAMLLVGNQERGATLLALGELASANEHLEKAVVVFDPRQPLASLVDGLRMASISFSYYCLYGLGYPDRAWARSREMLELAERSSHSVILTSAWCEAAAHHLLAGDSILAHRYAENAMARAEEMGFVTLLSQATTWHGAALIAQGRHEEGVAGLRAGISGWRATGGTPNARVLSLLAVGLGKLGRPKEGLQMVDEGFACIATSGGQISSPYLHIARGELLLLDNSSAATEAERCFRKAIEIARRQSARSPELRASATLARLLNGQGRRDEARAMLADIYNWFTEGFDTADLKDAKTLLDELSE
ncbi:MAG: hypothetical protein C5B58_02005 [Acidobacteria bacterium]|nr:MAG: hypothetical protein C5B58_02005 [Acidobacteriota bacterium]